MYKILIIIGVAFIAIGLAMYFIFAKDNMKVINGNNAIIVSTTIYENTSESMQRMTSYWNEKLFNETKEKANLGNVEAQLILGELYLKGDFVRIDYEKAEYWLLKAASKENDIAQAALGYLYMETKQFEKALIWSSKAAEADNPDAQYNLALLLGEQDNPDAKKIVELLENALRTQNNSAITKIEYALAWWYLSEKSVENVDLGLMYLNRALEKEDPYAEYLMGELYEEGKIFPKDISKATHFYRKAAAKQQPDAMERIKSLERATEDFKVKKHPQD